MVCDFAIPLLAGQVWKCVDEILHSVQNDRPYDQAQDSSSLCCISQILLQHIFDVLIIVVNDTAQFGIGKCAVNAKRL